VPPVEVTILIPAFNEAGRIERAVRESLVRLESEGAPGEVLVVDDGSTDATATIVLGLAAEDARVRLHRLPGNRGKGGAVRAGVFEARGDIVFVLDADLSTPTSSIGDALPHLRDGADVVTGSRHCAGASVLRRQGILRRSLGKGFLLLARRIADPRSTDITCGFKGFRRAAATAIFHRVTVDGWAFDAETALIARRLGLVRREVRPHADLVIVDAPATGHGVGLLAAPALVSEAIGGGPLGRLAGEVAEFVGDPARTAVVVAALAEEMPVQEALELFAMMRERLGRTPDLVAVNGLYPPFPTATVGAGSREQGAGGAIELWRQRRAMNERELERLAAACQGPLARIPLFPESPGPALVRQVADVLAGAIAPQEPR